MKHLERLFLIAIFVCSSNLYAQKSDIKDFLEQPVNYAKYSIYYESVPDWVWAKVSIAQRNGDKTSLFVISNDVLTRDSILMVEVREKQRKSFFTFDKSNETAIKRYLNTEQIIDAFMNQFVIGEYTGIAEIEYLPTVNQRYARFIKNGASFKLKGRQPSVVGYRGGRVVDVSPTKVYESSQAAVYEVEALMNFDQKEKLEEVLSRVAPEFVKLCKRCGLITSSGVFSTDLLEYTSTIFREYQQYDYHNDR